MSAFNGLAGLDQTSWNHSINSILEAEKRSSTSQKKPWGDGKRFISNLRAFAEIFDPKKDTDTALLISSRISSIVIPKLNARIDELKEGRIKRNKIAQYEAIVLYQNLILRKLYSQESEKSGLSSSYRSDDSASSIRVDIEETIKSSSQECFNQAVRDSHGRGRFFLIKNKTGEYSIRPLNMNFSKHEDCMLYKEVLSIISDPKKARDTTTRLLYAASQNTFNELSIALTENGQVLGETNYSSYFITEADEIYLRVELNAKAVFLATREEQQIKATALYTPMSEESPQIMIDTRVN